MLFQPHFLRNFLGSQRRNLYLWNYSFIVTSNSEPLFSFPKAIRTCTSTATLGESAADDGLKDPTKVFRRWGCSENDTNKVFTHPKDPAEVLRRWGCTESDINKVFCRQPSLRLVNGSDLESKLNFLRGLGLGASDLVKIINCRPRFLHFALTRYFAARVDELRALLGSTEVFLKAIVRNPSLLLYDFDKTVRPVVTLYEQQMGLGRPDLVSMLLARPTLFSRTTMDDDKLEYIQRTRVPRESKMYKYVVTIIGVSRVKTIGEKVANLVKFGFSEDEVLGLFGRSPLLMTLSLDKVQRNMTFILGTMKLPAKSVLDYPFLLYASLEDLLKPRVLLARKIQDMGLSPQITGPSLFRALRMSEKRFLNAFVRCHEEDVKDELLDYYKSAKRLKRLAKSSKKTCTDGFPF